MIVPDVNLLLYAHIRSFGQHARARRWWEALLNGEREVGISSPAIFGFVRLVTSPAVFDRPLAVADAVARVEEWLEVPHVHFALPGPRHALGERRAKATMNYLAARGVSAGRMTLISYGEERPLCAEKTEACWARNRRAHFLVKPR